MASAKCSAPEPYTGTRIDRVAVVVPVHNEEHALGQCLDALDCCTDDSAAVVAGFREGGVEGIVVEATNVGFARAAGMAEPLRRHGESGTWLATTDGDSIVRPHWVAAQVRHAASGARVVAGTVTVEDWGDRSSKLRDWARKDYRAVPHRHIHGANLSFAAAAYRAAGGFNPVTSDEDVRLVDAFRANGEPITWANGSSPPAGKPRINARRPSPTRMTASADAVHPAPRFRTGYLSLLLPAGSLDEDVRVLIRQLVMEALAASGEWPARIEVVTRQRTPQGPMKRRFVEYATGPPGTTPGLPGKFIPSTSRTSS
jgi:hypothetical protein